MCSQKSYLSVVAVADHCVCLIITAISKNEAISYLKIKGGQESFFIIIIFFS